MSHLMSSGPYEAERTGPPAPVPEGRIPYGAQPPALLSAEVPVLGGRGEPRGSTQQDKWTFHGPVA